jgi:hypothetical protein
VSVVLPVFEEQENLRGMIERLRQESILSHRGGPRPAGMYQVPERACSTGDVRSLTLGTRPG